MPERNGEKLRPAPSALDQASFLERFGSIYENSLWVAQAVWPMARSGSVDATYAMAGAMRAIVDEAPKEKRLALINAHPELARPPAQRAELTEFSRKEQASAGLDDCPPAQLEEFSYLNAQYRKRFGFPFIIAVKGLSSKNIISAMKARCENDYDAEFSKALSEIHKIAAFRLADLN